MDSFFVALQFLTRLPAPSREAPSADQLGQSALYYPAVGLLLGAILALLAGLLPERAPLLAAAIILAAWVWLTGGLHLDGLADCADAWVGGHGDRQRSLKIMKDPASGPIAVSVLVLALILKFAALAALLAQARWAPLLAAPLLGRSALLALMLTTDYVRSQGLAEALLQNFPRTAGVWMVCVGILLAWAGAGTVALLAAGGVLFWVRKTAIARLGGSTGDVYGAVVELVETTALAVAAL